MAHGGPGALKLSLQKRGLAHTKHAAGGCQCKKDLAYCFVVHTQGPQTNARAKRLSPRHASLEAPLSYKLRQIARQRAFRNAPGFLLRGVARGVV